MTTCLCGCGRPAGPGTRGLSRACYMRLYRAGAWEYLDRVAPRKKRGRPRRQPARLVELLAALRTLEAARG